MNTCARCKTPVVAGARVCPPCAAWMQREARFARVGFRVTKRRERAAKAAAFANTADDTDAELIARWRHQNPDHAVTIDANAGLAARCRKYGLTVSHWLELIARQDSRCAICTLRVSPLQLNIDHDHHTGNVRGLLCTPCNTGLGLLGIDGPDAPSRVAAIDRYISDRAGRAEYAATCVNEPATIHIDCLPVVHPDPDTIGLPKGCRP